MHIFYCGEIIFLSKCLFNFLLLPYSDGVCSRDQVVKKSEEETLMNEMTTKLKFYHICLFYNDGECSDIALNPLVNTLEKCLRYFERDNFDLYFKTALKNS